MIYLITSSVLNAPNCVCPDQLSIDAGKNIYPNGVFTIGGKEEAETIAAENRAVWLTQNASLFSVTKDINSHPLDTTWVACDLETETENSDVDYNIFNVVNGYYTLVTGLDNAKALLETTKANASKHFIVIVELETWPKENNISTGVQTF